MYLINNNSTYLKVLDDYTGWPETSDLITQLD